MSAIADSVTVTLTPAQVDLARRAMLESAATALRCAADQFTQLAEGNVMSSTAVADTRGSLRILDEELETLDALGWPDGELTHAERLARMLAAITPSGRDPIATPAAASGKGG